jgi:hypothetical protein
MNAKLRPEDRHAVDLLMDRMASAKRNGSAVYAGSNTALRPRVERLQRLLQLIELHEVSEPPRNLVARTLERIESRGHRHTRQPALDLGERTSHPA